jgi:uncharacterized membrane protein
MPAHRVWDVDGRPRAWMPGLTYPELVHLGLDEIEHWGRDSLQIRRALTGVVDDLLGVVHAPDRRAALLLVRRTLEDGPLDDEHHPAPRRRARDRSGRMD